MSLAPASGQAFPDASNVFANNQNWYRKYCSVDNKPSVEVYFVLTPECVVARSLFSVLISYDSP